jgi:hypothetical protein
MPRRLPSSPTAAATVYAASPTHGFLVADLARLAGVSIPTASATCATACSRRRCRWAWNQSSPSLLPSVSRSVTNCLPTGVTDTNADNSAPSSGRSLMWPLTVM